MPYDSTTWIQGQTSLNPAGQDYMRLRDAGYARNLAEINDKFQFEQVRNMSEMGARQLEQYGPQGQMWAQRLRENPYAAYELVKDAGGFTALEQKLRMGQAYGSAEMGRVMAEGGPEIYGNYQTGLVNQQNADSNTRNAASAAENAAANTRNAATNEAMIPVEWAKARATQAAADAKRGEVGKLERGQFAQINDPRTKEMGEFNSTADIAKQLITIDARDPSSQEFLLGLVEQLGAKQVTSPEIAARLHEIRSGPVAGMLVSGKSRDLGPVERQKLIDRALDIARIVMSEAPQAMDRYVQANDRMMLNPFDYQRTLPLEQMGNVADTYRRIGQYGQNRARAQGIEYTDPWKIFSNDSPDPFDAFDAKYGSNFGGQGGAPGEVVRKNPKDGKTYRRVGPDNWVEVK